MNIVSAKLKDYIPPEVPSHLYAFNIHVLGLYFSKCATGTWCIECVPLKPRLKFKLMNDKRCLYKENELSIDLAFVALARELIGLPKGVYTVARHHDDVYEKYWLIFNDLMDDLGELMFDKKISWHIHFTPTDFVFTSSPIRNVIITRSYSNKSLPYALYQWALELVNSFEEKDLEQNVWLEPAQDS